MGKCAEIGTSLEVRDGTADGPVVGVWFPPGADVGSLDQHRLQFFFSKHSGPQRPPHTVPRWQLWHGLESAIASKKERGIPIVKCDGVPFRIDGADRNNKESESSGLEGEHCEREIRGGEERE
jgi:hypothetical protein